jgi:hypothetical protein
LMGERLDQYRVGTEPSKRSTRVSR